MAPMPGAKQICPICSDEVTEEDYRRELTCSYSLCPGGEHAYHEECISKYIRKLKLPVDQLIGYACPVVLSNGKPCSGRIASTHHRQPLNKKKKQKRVEAAALAAAAPKSKVSAPKAKEAKAGVAAATAAMRPAGEGALRQIGVSVNNIKSVASALPTVKMTVKSVAPGSGPAARLNGTALAVSNNSAMTPERVVRQRIIPGWSGPEKVAKGGSFLPQVDRDKLAALKAEAKAAAGRRSKAQVASASVGQSNKDNGGARVHPQHCGDGDGGSEDSDTTPFLRYAQEAGNDDHDAGDDSITPSEKPQDFNLAPEDFPAFPLSATPSVKTTSNAVAPAMTMAAKRHVEHQLVLSGDSSVDDSPLVSPSATKPMAAADSAAPDSPAAHDVDENDPVMGYDKLYTTEEGLVVVQDVHGKCFEVEAVYGPSPEFVGFEDGTGAVTYYVVVRASTLVKAQRDTTVAGGNGDDVLAGLAAAKIPDQAAPPPVSATPAGDVQFAGQQATFGMGDGGDRSAKEEPIKSSTGPAMGQPSVNQGYGAGVVDEQGAELDDLLALCMVSAPDPKPSLFQSQLDPTPSLYQSQQSYPYAAAAPTHVFQANMYGNVDFEAPFGMADAPAGTADEAEDVGSLMQLLCV